MKVIIAGSRSIPGARALEYVEDAVAASGFTITEVVCGTAKGIDSAGKWWAELNSIPVKEFPPDWDSHGKAAGPIRNREMAQYAEALILIRDGKSPGSASMLRSAKQEQLKIYERKV